MTLQCLPNRVLQEDGLKIWTTSYLLPRSTLEVDILLRVLTGLHYRVLRLAVHGLGHVPPAA